jgi:hypothetical protein
MPKPVMVIAPMMMPAAAQAAATSTAPMAPSANPSRMFCPKTLSGSRRSKAMMKEAAMVARIAQNTARSGE